MLLAAIVASIISRLRLKRRPASPSRAVLGSKFLAALPLPELYSQKSDGSRNKSLPGRQCPPSLPFPHLIYSRCKRYHLFPLEPLLLFYYLLFAVGLKMVREGCFWGCRAGYSGSKSLGRTWRSCAVSAGSVLVCKLGEER